MRSALAVLVALAGCGLAPPLEPHVVRASAAAQALVPAAGQVFAREDLPEARAKGLADIQGDPVRLDHDVDLDLGLGLALDLDVSPTDDDELGVAVRLVPGLTGRHLLRRPRRFDGAVFGPDERVSARLTSGTLRGGWSRRVLAPRGALDLDLYARVGVERHDVDARLRGGGDEEHRQLRVGAPWVGLEARLRLAEAPRLIAHAGVDLGYWHHDGVRLGLVDATAGLRCAIVGPLFADLSYALQLRDAEADLGEGEVSRVEGVLHGVSLGVGLAF